MIPTSWNPQHIHEPLAEADIDSRIGARVRALGAERGLTLDGAAVTGPDGTTPAPVPIRALDAAEAEARADELADVLLDAVAHGASVNFMAGLARGEALDFWRAQLPAIAEGGTRLLAADAGGRLVGTVLLFLARQPNAPHRAEIGKMLVLSSMRRRGLGRRLLDAAEAAARDAGRTLLLLDTETGSAGEALYRRCGWTTVGGIPDHSFTTDGRLAEATVFYKALGPHRRPPGAAA